jgi:hypothetical protein
MTWEELLTQWSQGPSQAEQDRWARTAHEISDALKNYPSLHTRSLEIFVQGSFANRVNVRKESDVDVCSLCSDTYFYDNPLGHSIQEYVPSFTPATYNYQDYKNDVQAALVARFGHESVKRGNKAIDVHNRRYDIDADVIPTFEYKDYRTSASRPAMGTAMYSDDGQLITNFPKQQYDNGVAKHDATSRRFKRQVKIQKTLRNSLEDLGYSSAKPIKSFFIESLCWNAPNHCYGYPTYYQDFEQVLPWIYNKTATDEEAAGLLEVNGIKRLFGPHNSWTRFQVRSYIESAWAYTH